MYLSLGSNESVAGFIPGGLTSNNTGGGTNQGSPLGWAVKNVETILGSLFNGAGAGTGNFFVSPAVPPSTFSFSATGVPGALGSGVTAIAASLGDNGLALNIDPTVVNGYLSVNMGN